MQLTKKASYGLIAVVELARAPEGISRSASWIAEQYGLPPAFIEKILHELRRAGLVVSRQGCCGGYALALPAGGVTVLQVLESLGEALDVVDCLDGGSSCKLTRICPTRGAWKTINDRFRALLATISLADLGEGTTPSPRGRAVLPAAIPAGEKPQ